MTGDLLAAGPGTLLVLSPHLDDAALSCGASMAQAVDEGWRVAAVVFFAGRPDPGTLTPGARDYHEQSGLGDDAMDARRREDETAMALLSAESRRLDLLEAVYRRRPDGTPAYDGFLEMSHPPGGPEPEIVAAIGDGIAAALATYRPSLVVFPMGVGGHVDHLAVHAAALAAARERDGERSGERWFGFEDIPYAQFPWFAGWDVALGDGWAPTAHAVDESAWTRKLEALACYPSQLKALFGEPAAWQELLATYARTLTSDGAPTERFWHPRPPR